MTISNYIKIYSNFDRNVKILLLLIGSVILVNFILNNLFLIIFLSYAITFSLIIFYRIELGIIVYLGVILFLPNLTYYISTPALQYIDELLVIYLVALTISRVVIQKKKFTSSFTSKYFYSFLCLMFLSLLVNEVPIKNFVLFTVSIIKPVALFFVIINMNKKQLTYLKKILLKFLLVLGLIQLPFVINNIISIGGLSQAIGQSFYYVGDYITGTFRSSDTVGYLILIDIIILYCISLSNNKNKYYTLLCSVFVLVLIIASVKRLLIMLPIIFVIGIYSLKKNIKYKKLLTIVLIMILALPVYSFEKNLILNTSFWSLDSNVNPLLRVEKFQGYYDLFIKARNEMEYKLLGAGPGMYGSAVAQNLGAPFAEKYINYYSRLIPSGEGGTLMTRSSAIIALISEMGIISLLIVTALLIAVYKKVYLQLKLLKNYNSDFKIYAFCILCLIPTLLVLSFFQNIFEGGFIISAFWVFNGVLLNDNNFRYLSEK